MNSRRYAFSLLIATVVYAMIGIALWMIVSLEIAGEESKETIVEVAILEPQIETAPPSESVLNETHVEPEEEPEAEPKPEPEPNPEPEPEAESEPVPELKPEPEIVPKPKPKSMEKIEKQAKKLKPKPAPKKVVKKSSKPRAASSRQQFRKGENAFLQRVRATIIRNKKYPRAAIKRNIQGRVKVVFDIEKNGSVSHIRVSGGSKILQRAARKSVSRSFPIKIPAKIAKKFPRRNISVNLNFRLK